MQRFLLILAAVIAVISVANGLYMITNPIAWYHAVPGVIETGPPNTHFITDIGFAYFASGVLLIAALQRPLQRGELALAAALWPALHAGFHIAGDISAGAAAISATEVSGIYLPVAIQIALGVYWLRHR